MRRAPATPADRAGRAGDVVVARAVVADAVVAAARAPSIARIVVATRGPGRAGAVARTATSLARVVVAVAAVGLAAGCLTEATFGAPCTADAACGAGHHCGDDGRCVFDGFPGAGHDGGDVGPEDGGVDGGANQDGGGDHDGGPPSGDAGTRDGGADQDGGPPPGDDGGPGAPDAGAPDAGSERDDVARYALALTTETRRCIDVNFAFYLLQDPALVAAITPDAADVAALVASFSALADDPLVTVDRAALETCVAYLQTQPPCPAFNDQPSAGEVQHGCPRIFSGTQPRGAPCTRQEQCVATDYCTASPDQCGACAARRGLGADCAIDRCDVDLVCRFVGGASLCAAAEDPPPPPVVDTPCDPAAFPPPCGDPARFGMACTGLSACGAPACAADSDCGGGSRVCRTSECCTQGPPRCRPIERRGPGLRCDYGDFRQCQDGITGVSCENTVCTAKHALGTSCLGSVDCDPTTGTCLTGVCTPPVDDGQACGTLGVGPDCRFTHTCLDPDADGAGTCIDPARPAFPTCP